MTHSEVEADSVERLNQMRSAGIRIVEILPSPNPGQQCEACLAMASQQIEIDFATPLPLPGCTQRECTCVYLAKK